MGCLLPVAKAAVCCADPPQLVAFVEPRKEAGQAALGVCAFAAPSCASQATIRAHELMEHCRKELMPAYLPKLIVVLDAGPEPMLVRVLTLCRQTRRDATKHFPPGLPVLPNGKVNYKSLKEMADKEASQAQETVMDSLGQMKSMSRAAILENAVIHRCYAFWMLGVLTDHYAWCAMSTDPKDTSTRHLLAGKPAHIDCVIIHVHEDTMQDPTGMRSLPFCTALASWNVAPWAEALVRSLGNDQASGKRSDSCGVVSSMLWLQWE